MIAVVVIARGFFAENQWMEDLFPVLYSCRRKKLKIMNHDHERDNPATRHWQTLHQAEIADLVLLWQMFVEFLFAFL